MRIVTRLTDFKTCLIVTTGLKLLYNNYYVVSPVMNIYIFFVGVLHFEKFNVT